MGERSGHPPGTFSWADLGTPDLAGASAFYAGLLGWEGEDRPVPGGSVYRMMSVNGLEVAGLHELPADSSAGRPPMWLSYVTVADADASAERAARLGATVVEPPFDVTDAGRMALVLDPQGAMLALWQAGATPGARLVNDPGAMCMNQLTTSDPAGAIDFHRGLFGWEFTQVSPEPQPYWSITNAGRLNGGMMPLPPGQAPPHWLVYFTVEDIDAATETIGRLGGSVVVPPTAVPAGRFIVARDPQGAHFALFEGAVDP